jgi:hypothetical protein
MFVTDELGGISVLTRSLFDEPDRRAFTLTERFELASSLFRLMTTKKRTTRMTPMIPSGMKIHVGTPSFRTGSAAIGARSTTGRVADKGRPQLGQATAALEISCPHSGQ